MADAFLDAFRVPEVRTFMARPIATLLDEASPNFPIRLVTFLSPYAYWGVESDPNSVTRWAAAALAAPYADEVGQSVVDTLLQVASHGRLQPYIPIEIWALLKKRPSFPPICKGRKLGTAGRVVRRVRELEDAEILESYFFLVWSEWNVIHSEGLAEMVASIRKDFGGIGMGCRREVLIKRLDHIFGQLDMGFEHLKQQNPTLMETHIPASIRQYRMLEVVLLEVDGEALEVLTRTPFRFTNSLSLLTPVDGHRIPLDVRLCTPSSMSVVAPYSSFSPLRTSFAFGLPSVTPSSSVDQSTTARFFKLDVRLLLPSSYVDILCRRRISRRACCACHRFLLYTVSCYITCLYAFELGARIERRR